MRITAPDVVLFIVGLLLFSGASYALVKQGGISVLGQGGSATGIYTVEYTTAQQELKKENVASFANANVEFAVNATDVSKVEVKIACTDQVPGNTFQVNVQIAGPSNLTGSGSKPCGSFDVEVPIATVPAKTTVQGATLEQAKATLPKNTNATGAWKVTITGSRSGGPAPIPGAIPAPNPTGTISFVVEAWTPKLTAVQK